MSIITLISDWNNSDYYSGTVKGLIASHCDDARVVDISHNIEHFNITQAAFIIASTYKKFPKGTIHIIAVEAEATKKNPHVIIKHDGHYFICSDNGIPALLFPDKPELIIELDTLDMVTSFPEADVFAKSAAYIALGNDVRELGDEKSNILRKAELLPTIESNSISGRIVYNDSYGNAISNISKALFENLLSRFSRFEISLGTFYYTIDTIVLKYSEVNITDMLAIFNSLGYLEIAQRNGSAKDMMGLKTDTGVLIKFF